MKQGFIEQLEGDWATIYQADRSTVRVKRTALPPEAREGYFVVEIDGQDKFTIDYAITAKREREMRRMSDAFHE